MQARFEVYPWPKEGKNSLIHSESQKTAKTIKTQSFSRYQAFQICNSCGSLVKAPLELKLHNTNGKSATKGLS